MTEQIQKEISKTLFRALLKKMHTERLTSDQVVKQSGVHETNVDALLKWGKFDGTISQLARLAVYCGLAPKIDYVDVKKMSKEERNRANEKALSRYIESRGIDDPDALPFGVEVPPCVFCGSTPKQIIDGHIVCPNPRCDMNYYNPQDDLKDFGQWVTVAELEDVTVVKRKTVVGSTQYAAYDGNPEGASSPIFDTATMCREAVEVAIKDAWGESRPWIDAKSHKPKPFLPVLITGTSAPWVCLPDTGLWTGSEWQPQLNAGQDDLEQGTFKVTHWMELPKPPQA